MRSVDETVAVEDFDVDVVDVAVVDALLLSLFATEFPVSCATD